MDIEVAKGDLRTLRVTEATPRPLGAGEARLRIDAFGLSSNNVTYAVFGDALRYWDFFPVSGDPAGAWGRVPVWGFAEVIESRSPDLAVGERLYGCYPMADELVIEVGRADERGVSDVVAHRAATAGAYSRYVRCAADPLHRTDREDEQMLLYPLFFTSFVIDDYLAELDERVGIGTGTGAAVGTGAARDAGRQVVISSASSKTAIGTAHLLHTRGVSVVGLTSAANADFVAGLGCYDEVLTYDDVRDGLRRAPSAYVDIAGNADVTRAVHERLDASLAVSLIVGGTHWDHRAETPGGDLPGPAPEFFFAPTQIAKRTQDWGRDELERRMGEAWDTYADWAASWLAVSRVVGAEAVRDLFGQLLDGHVDPRLGFVCTLAPDA